MEFQPAKMISKIVLKNMVITIRLLNNLKPSWKWYYQHSKIKLFKYCVLLL